MSEILSWARARTPDMTALLRELVEIESPSSDAEGVRRVASRLAQELMALGLQAELVPVPGAGPVLRARGALEGASSQGVRPVMLLGHLDTVWPLGTLAARPVRAETNTFRGPGSFDMKGGLTVVAFALRALVERGRLPPVTVFFTPLEEVGGEPYRERMESEMKASAAVLGFEPAWPGGAVKTARKGSGSFLLRARGRAAHAGADFEKGASAVLELSRKVLEASTLTDLAHGVTVNVGVVRGGIRPNVIPDLAEAEIDVRYETIADGRRLESRLRSLGVSDPRVVLELEGSLHYPPLERGPHVLAVYQKAKAVAQELGLELAETSTGGASEASFASALGIPTLDGLGPDGDGAHAEHEHVLIPSLPERVALAAGLVERLAADPAVGMPHAALGGDDQRSRSS